MGRVIPAAIQLGVEHGVQADEFGVTGGVLVDSGMVVGLLIGCVVSGGGFVGILAGSRPERALGGDIALDPMMLSAQRVRVAVVVLDLQPGAVCDGERAAA